MKVLLANKFLYPRGGDCIHTMQLRELLISKGHQVHVYSMDYPDNISLPEDKYWPSQVSFNDKSPIKLYKALIRPFGDREVRKSFMKQVVDFQPDVVHVHNIHSQISPVIVEIAKKQNIPVVWTLHDYKLICPAYTCLDNQLNICEECFTYPQAVLQKKCIKGSQLGSLIGFWEAKKWNKDRISLFDVKFVSPSGFLKSKMIQAGFSESKISHIYNFILEKEYPQQVNLKRTKHILYVGRLSKEKGVETLCKAFKSQEGVKLDIIGDGPIRKELKKKYSNDNVSFLGFRNWDFIKEKLSQASFLVAPSEWYENNPLTILEALAMGTPVLGARIGGIPELVNNENGMLFESGKVEDLKQKIEMMNRICEWDYLKISHKAKEKFSTENFYNRLMKIYQV